MYCCNCGFEVDSDKAFCDACGAVIKIDGIIQQNTVSDTPIPTASGIRGQVTRSKYIILSVCVVFVMAAMILYTVFGKYDMRRDYSDKEYQNAVKTPDSSGREQNYGYTDSSDKTDQFEQDVEAGYPSDNEETDWEETDEDSYMDNAREDELEEETTVESYTAEFLCEFSSDRLITQEDMDVLLSQDFVGLPDGRELPQMIINEIYARHGYSFKNEFIQAYFEEKEWYRNIESYSGDMDSIYAGMSEIERDNIKFLEQYR